jgi:hypothetical protein
MSNVVCSDDLLHVTPLLLGWTLPYRGSKCDDV